MFGCLGSELVPVILESTEKRSIITHICCEQFSTRFEVEFSWPASDSFQSRIISTKKCIRYRVSWAIFNQIPCGISGPYPGLTGGSSAQCRARRVWGHALPEFFL